MISLIAAMTPDRVIGLKGQMPWHLPADLAWFKQQTLGKPIVMGRKTWEAIGRPLPQRQNIVVSKQLECVSPSVTVVTNPNAALALTANAPEVMIIGGAQLYHYFLPQAQRLYLTLIAAQLEGDTVFPDYNQLAWRLIEQHSHPADACNAYACDFLILERV